MLRIIDNRNSRDLIKAPAYDDVIELALFHLPMEVHGLPNHDIRALSGHFFDREVKAQILGSPLGLLGQARLHVGRIHLDQSGRDDVIALRLVRILARMPTARLWFRICHVFPAAEI